MLFLLQTTTAAIRISDQVTFDESNISTAGAGIAIKNNADATVLYRDTATETYFQDTAKMVTVLEDDDTTLTITEYDRSWIPGWTK